MSAAPGRLAAAARVDLVDVLRATSGELARLGACTAFAGVTTDSRTIEPGELFVAVRGETHDGHAFLADALARGAGGLVVETGTPLDGLEGTVIQVRETLAALGDLAAFHRRRHPVPLLAVAGSNGKTTTKEMLATILRAAYGDAHVVATRGSQNNLVGLPLTLLRVDDQTRVVVLEIGMNAPGEVWRLAEIAQPDVGLITCIAEEHLQGVGSMRGAAEANAELWRRLKPSGTAIVNAEDPYVRGVAAAFSGRRVAFGDGGDVRACDVVDDGIDGTRFVLDAAGEREPVRLAVAGRHNVANALAATAAARAVGVPLATACRALETFTAPTMRMQRVPLASGAVVLNDCYNANPGSMAAALQTLAASRAERRLAVLGEMLELGASAERAHRELGARAAAARVDVLFLMGSHAALVRDAAVAAGLPAERVTIGATHEAVADAVRATLRPGDLLLLKGSRGAALEKVLHRLGPEGGRVMLYLVLYNLRSFFEPLNVFKYITFRTLLAALTALVVSLLIGPWLIRRLTALQIGQAIREDGPQSHAKKAGTPTMGGTLIIFSLTLATLLLADVSSWYVWLALLVTLSHGLIGFLDDSAKVRRRSSRGLPGRARLVAELVIGGIASTAIFLWSEHGGHVTMPFLKTVQPDLGLLYIPFGAIVIAGAANAVNLTDGLDGLAIGPVMIAASTYVVFAYVAGNARFAEYLQIPYVAGAGELAVFCGALAAAGLGFLWFNAYPAQMFMGDVGSLAIGSALGVAALITRQELVLLLVGFVFVVETLSVIGQVVSFKLRRKRIFRMAPIHHHFELLGWPEPQIIVRFWIVSIVCALLALSTLKLR